MRFPGIRRFRSAQNRVRSSPLMNWVIVLAFFAVALVLCYHFLFEPGNRISADVIDFSKSVERIEELSTVRSHIRFAVVVREEGGNIVVRRFVDQGEYIGMDGIGAALFQDPTMFVELHGVATYGVRLHDLASRIVQDDSTVTIPLPRADVLDVKLVAADTRVVAQMKGLFRSSNTQLLLAADQRGEEFVRQFAEQDSSLHSLAIQRATDVIALLVEQGGKRAVFK